MTLGTLFFGVVLLVLVALAINRKAVSRIFNAGRDQAGKLGRAAENFDPLASYQQIIDDATEQVKKAKEGLQKAVGLIKSVERQVISDRQNKARLEARIKNALAEGNNTKAAEYAATLSDTETSLVENEKQLKSHQDAYQGYVNDVKRQQDKIVKAEREAAGLGVRLEMSNSNREFQEFQASFSTNNGALRSLDEKREAILRKIDENNAFGQVNKDVGSPTSYEEEDADLDRKIKAEEVLKRFQTPASN